MQAESFRSKFRKSLRIESLEQRQMMAGDVFAGLASDDAVQMADGQLSLFVGEGEDAGGDVGLDDGYCFYNYIPGATWDPATCSWLPPDFTPGEDREVDGSYTPGQGSGGEEHFISDLFFARHDATGEIDFANEGDEFVVHVQVDGSFESAVEVEVWADLNFDGNRDAGEIARGVLESASDGYGLAAFKVVDDGPVPGNGTPVDVLKVQAKILGDGSAGEPISKTLPIRNVAPKFVHAPQLSLGFDPNDNPIAVVSARFWDPGLQDSFSAKLSLGGVEVGHDVEIVPDSVYGAGYYELSLSTELAASQNPFPVKFSIQDDDTGAVDYSFGRTHVAVNRDDDNENSTVDLEETNELTGEDDLVELDLSEMVQRVAHLGEGHLILSYDTATVRLWTSATKSSMILPFYGHPEFPEANVKQYELENTVYVEGITPGESHVTLKWLPSHVDPWAQGCSVEAVYAGSIEVVVWDMDLNIDSDNNNGTALPERSEREEFLEDNEYGLGKLVMQNYGVVDAADSFTPLVLHLPQGLNPQDPEARIQLDFDSHSSAGTIALWLMNKSVPERNGDTVSEGGHLVESGVEYALSELHYNAYTGEILLFIAGMAENPAIKQLKGVEENGKPQEYIETKLLVDGDVIVSDQVKYLVSQTDSFFYRFQNSEELRNAVASVLVHRE